MTPNGWLQIGLFLLAVLLTSPLWAPDYVKDRFTGTQISDESSDEVEFEGSTQDRIETWRTIGTLVANHPLDGVGYMGLTYVLSSISSTLPMEIKDSAHNTYLRMLGELGLPGLALFLWLLWTAWRLSLTAAKVSASPFERALWSAETTMSSQLMLYRFLTVSKGMPFGRQLGCLHCRVGSPSVC